MTPKEFETFPKVMGWIKQILWAHRAETRLVISKDFKRLPLYFSQAQMEAAKFVVVDRVPLPPLSSIGLSRFSEFEQGDYDGITYLDTYFPKKLAADDETLHFHEMSILLSGDCSVPSFSLPCMLAAWKLSAIAIVRSKRWPMMRRSYLRARDPFLTQKRSLHRNSGRSGTKQQGRCDTRGGSEHIDKLTEKYPRAQLALGVRHSTNKGLIYWRGWGDSLSNVPLH
jgi:hypothetical protein